MPIVPRLLSSPLVIAGFVLMLAASASAHGLPVPLPPPGPDVPPVIKPPTIIVQRPPLRSPTVTGQGTQSVPGAIAAGAGSAPTAGNPATGGTTPGAASGRPIRGATPQGRTTPGVGRSTRRKSKALNAPWRADLRIPWKTALLPVDERQGYDGKMLSVDDTMARPLSDGGWFKADRPSLVLVFDHRVADHRRAVRLLEHDLRVLTAANLFNCFRVDSKMAGEAGKRLRLRVYDAKGALVGSIAGRRRLRGVLDLLDKAYAGHKRLRLRQVLPRATWLLEEIAKVKRALSSYEHMIVCPDCGKERKGAKKLAKAMQLRLSAAQRNLDLLR